MKRGVWLIVVAAALVWTRGVGANSLAPLEKVRRTNFVSAGVGGLRDKEMNNCPGTISLTGVSGVVTKAYLFWQGLSKSAAPVGATVTFNGQAVQGKHIGFSSDGCWSDWGFLNTQAYRADVTSLVQGNGSFPLYPGTDGLVLNGASLVVFFDDGDPANDRDVYLFNGNDNNIGSQYDGDGWDAHLNGIVYGGGPASIQLHAADGQRSTDAALILNNSPLVFSGPIFEGDSVPGPSPFGVGNYWDIKTFDLTSHLTPGPNDLHLTHGTLGDCVGLVAALVSVPAVRDAQAPEVRSAVRRRSLWPPNHRFIDAGLTVDARDDRAGGKIEVQVFSDEADGAGEHSPDAMPGHSFSPDRLPLRLRAERGETGDGRVYLVLTRATDADGNVGWDCSAVTVPKSQNRESAARVAARAEAAAAHCRQFGAPPDGYVPVGGGPVKGPKQ